MQDNLSATFKGETVTVNELTVKQVREVFRRLAGEDHQFIDDLLDQPIPAPIVMESTGFTLEQLESATPTDLAMLYQTTMKVNPFCRPREQTKTGTKGTPAKRYSFRRELDRAICFLIALGHIRVWEYGFSFFLTALKETQPAELQR